MGAPPPHPGGPGAPDPDDLSLDEFYEHAVCGYLSLTADGTITRVNETFLDWTGHSREDVLASTRFVSLLTVGAQIFYETRCAPLLLAGRSVDQVSLDLRRADGAVVPVLLGARVHATATDGRPSVIRVTLVDLSERRRFEEELVARNLELARANEEYDTFAHAAAHDLQSPLRGIRQNTEFFLEDVENADLPGDVVDQLHTVVRLADRMQRMLADLLVYAQAGRGALHVEPVSLTAVVGEVVDLLGDPARRAAPAVHDAALSADRGALRQVLLNLVGNAIKYADGPPAIEIGACSLEDARRVSVVPPSLADVPPSATVITVADRGRGIDPASRDRVFELFRQVDPDAEGSGTGLALCRLICRRHGGDIWVTSELGRGSTFFALLTPGQG